MNADLKAFHDMLLVNGFSLLEETTKTYGISRILTGSVVIVHRSGEIVKEYSSDTRYAFAPFFAERDKFNSVLLLNQTQVIKYIADIL